jgi:hypothetical protein
MRIWSAGPEAILADNSPNAKHFERIARILEDLAKLDGVDQQNRNDR